MTAPIDRRRIGGRAGLAMGLVGLNVILATLNLDKHEVLPFSLGASAIFTDDGTSEGAVADDTVPTTDTSLGDSGITVATDAATTVAADSEIVVIDDWPGGRPAPPEAPVARVATIEPDGSLQIVGSAPDWSTAVAIGERAAARMPDGINDVINLVGYHPQASSDVTAGDVFFEQGALFEIGEAVLDPSSYPRLDLVTQLLLNNPTLLATIIGHTDDQGDPDANAQLGLQRAQAMRDYMVLQGISERQIGLATAGEDFPAAPNDSQAGRESNRRIELRIKNFFTATGL
jgi:outer membrane protein OmpA-like peptidoglycan-associated protein